MSYIHKIKELIDKKKITKRELAQAIGKNENSIANYLSGKTKMDVETMLGVATALNVSVCVFFNQSQEEQSELLEVIDIFKKFSIEDNKTAIETLKNYKKGQFDNDTLFNAEIYLSKYELLSKAHIDLLIKHQILNKLTVEAISILPKFREEEIWYSYSESEDIEY